MPPGRSHGDPDDPGGPQATRESQAEAGRGSLPELLRRVESGERLPTDPWLSVLPQPSGRVGAVLSFPGHIVLAADVAPEWARAHLPAGDLSAPLCPPFLHAIERHLSRRVNSVDMILLADRLDGPPPLPLRAEHDVDHPRARRARRYREDVRAWTSAGAGVLVLGRGLGGRWEAAIEVSEPSRGAGLGRLLATAARHLVPEYRPIWAQIAPGNAASVRAFLAAGYRPVGAEALLVTQT